MKTYKIDKGIDLPAVAFSNGDNSTSRVVMTLALLEKGESFLIKDPLEAMRAEKRTRDYMRRERERGSKKQFAARRLHGGVRIWRIK